jgi:adenylate cyclase
MITAQALDTTMTGDYLYRTPQADTYEIVFLALLLLLLILVIPRTSVLLAVPLLFFIEGGVAYGAFMAYANKGFLVDPSWTMLSVFLIWSHSVYNNFATQSRLRQQIKKQFEHYLDPGMVKKLQKDPSLLKLGGEKRDMTFLFCDIRGFTPISEKYKGDPEGLTKLINRFLTRMTNVIIANGGTIDKFMGDCIMAFWNAPIEDLKHQQHAVQAAIQMQEELLKLNVQLAAEGLPNIAIGIGINTGEALVGNMGSDQRFDYSVIGDAVNLAARLESSSKTLGKTLVIGQDTFKSAKLDFDFEYIDQITVKGKTEEIKVYTVKH